jgi:two-component system sensor histidine kinase PilS (NtrC family)
MKDSRPSFFGTQIFTDSTPREGGTDYWRSLFYLNLYRMLLAVFFVTASIASFSVGSLGSRHPELFAYASFIYAFLSLAFAFSIHNGWPRYITQCRLQILADIVIIIVLYHASAGRGAGLEILLFISVSASGILLGGRAALITASAATILLILEHFYVIATSQRTLGGFTTLGFIGSGLFVTAFIIYNLSLMLRKTEVEIAQQNINIQKLSHINDLIVDQLHSGVIVVDQSLQVVLINDSGRNLLDIPDSVQLPQPLNKLLQDTKLDLNIEKENIDENESKIKLKSGKTLLAHYKPLGDSFENGYVILLDDYSQIEQDKKNEKFMAMGRLSASIAHEIRNPLGAISHAGQLLAESPSIIKSDSRLVEIIESQSQRINQIIKTILELGQTNEQQLQKIPLYDWLQRIIDNFIIERNLSDSSILLNGNKSISACGDPEQLQHVILNLLSNAQRYANTDINPFVVITIDDNEPGAMMSSISISDNGPGISENIQDKIFEPFFTTSSTGNGLGLYIARKICLSNHGYLDYIYNKEGDGFFRLTLAGNRSCQNIAGDNKQV